MTPECRLPVMRTWQSLLMARRRVLDAVAADLKAQNMPPIGVCLVLIMLSLEGQERLRPHELERKLEMPQYTMSRLLDRMEKQGLILREPCTIDGRGHHVALTGAGRESFKTIWPTYCAAIERHLGQNLCDVSAGDLADLLDKIGRPPAFAGASERRSDRRA